MISFASYSKVNSKIMVETLVHVVLACASLLILNPKHHLVYHSHASISSSITGLNTTKLPILKGELLRRFDVWFSHMYVVSKEDISHFQLPLGTSQITFKISKPYIRTYRRRVCGTI